LGRTFTGRIAPALRLAHLFDHLVGPAEQASRSPSGSGGVSKVSGNFMAGIEAAWSIAATFARLALELRDETPRRR